MLAKIMCEAAEDAKRINVNRHLVEMRREMKSDEGKWADRINEIKSGRH